MLKRIYRLPARVKLSHSSSYKLQTLRVMIAKNNLPHNRFGFVIAKKIDKRSVTRNRTKRVLRSCIEEMQQKIIVGYDMLFILQKNAVGQNRQSFYIEIEKLLREKKLINLQNDNLT